MRNGAVAPNSHLRCESILAITYERSLLLFHSAYFLETLMSKSPRKRVSQRGQGLVEYALPPSIVNSLSAVLRAL